MPAKKTGVEVNREELAETFGVSTNTITQWIKKGMPVVAHGGQGKPWRFNTADVHAWHLDRIREQLTGAAGTYDDEKTRKMRIEADLAEIELRKARGEVVELEIVAEAVKSEYATVRARLGSLPGIVAPKLDTERAGEFLPVIADSVNEVLQELSADERIGGGDRAKKPKGRSRKAARDKKGDAEAGSAS